MLCSTDIACPYCAEGVLAYDTEARTLVWNPDRSRNEPCRHYCYGYYRITRRGDGVGTRLSEAAERLARDRGRDRVSISAGEANEGALRLYRRLGYRNADIPPQRVVETIAIRGHRVDIDDTLIYLVKDLPTVQR